MAAGGPSRVSFLTVAALGVVFGDIGTSPLYALRECFAGAHAIEVTLGLDWSEEDTTSYLAHLTLLATDRIGMSAWRDQLFIFLARNARRATNFFCLSPDRVVEIGIQLRI